MRAVLALALTLLCAPAAAQKEIPPERRMHAIAETYRAGNTDAALQLLAADGTETHPIDVKLKNRRGTIQARRGYWR